MSLFIDSVAKDYAIFTLVLSFMAFGLIKKGTNVTYSFCETVREAA